VKIAELCEMLTDFSSKAFCSLNLEKTSGGRVRQTIFLQTIFQILKITNVAHNHLVFAQKYIPISGLWGVVMD
jgi:hypothetical protein